MKTVAVSIVAATLVAIALIPLGIALLHGIAVVRSFLG